MVGKGTLVPVWVQFTRIEEGDGIDGSYDLADILSGPRDSQRGSFVVGEIRMPYSRAYYFTEVELRGSAESV